MFSKVQHLKLKLKSVINRICYEYDALEHNVEKREFDSSELDYKSIRNIDFNANVVIRLPL